MKTYEVVYQVKAVITANSKERATAEVSHAFWDADRGMANFAVYEVEEKSMKITERELSL